MPDLRETQVISINYDYCQNCKQKFQVGEGLSAVVVTTQPYSTDIRFVHADCPKPVAPRVAARAETGARPR